MILQFTLCSHLMYIQHAVGKLKSGWALLKLAMAKQCLYIIFKHHDDHLEMHRLGCCSNGVPQKDLQSELEGQNQG